MRVNLMHNPDTFTFSRILYLSSIWIFGVVVLSYPFLFPPEKEFNDPSDSYIPFKEADLPDFSSVRQVVERKKAFFDYLTPAINNHNTIIIRKRQFLHTIEHKVNSHKSLTLKEKHRLKKMAKTYRVDTDLPKQEIVAKLLKRIDVIPPELVLMQAANESAWGTSRFAREGYNFFGLWCFRKGCGFVPKSRNDGAAHEVAKFKNLDTAMATYFRNLNRHYAYEDLRTIRHQLRSNHQPITAEALAKGLHRYSERGEDYIDELIKMIRFNRKFINQ
ncbi:glucosaminidase domain-containing protein [Aliiglaciecola sp. LCG003]|uniref:glucosaminidase domain-containing protein n=1 Tax=Aliiglaciecola sp. LCG003 TaxID=3053655 RepID=UPI0025727476|nr:glucosaminidase domain-containing protein [Aliiglaciecola sp. LCG003]WJG07596.1 glucosaminidase domain-containing protein [Aliiglaciecola sp. LCG003]